MKMEIGENTTESMMRWCGIRGRRSVAVGLLYPNRAARSRSTDL